VGVYAFLFLKDRDLEVIHRRERKKKHHLEVKIHLIILIHLCISILFFPRSSSFHIFPPYFLVRAFSFLSFIHFSSFLSFSFCFLFSTRKESGKKKTKDERKNLAKL